MNARALRVAAVVLLLASAAGAQIDTAILRPAGYHPSNVAYYNTPYFANALAHGGEWYTFTGFDFGTPLDFNNAPGNQFVNGYPQFLTSGQKLRGFLFGLNINNTDVRPAGWPARDTLTKGHVVLTWQGNADVRLVNCTFQAGESNGGSTGSINGGRRVYICSSGLTTLEVQEIITPVTDMKVWLPALDNPATAGVNESQTTSLENQAFHPLLLQRIADRDWGFIRFMDWGATNASPQLDWADRRKPGHIFQAGIINHRSPTTPDDGLSPGDRETGVAFEHMIALCNATGRNMWINVPHLASDDFITKLAQVIRFGSDANGNPALGGSPVFPPLDPNLKVYIEYSNEIWSSGFAFPQGNWAQARAVALGIATDTNDFAGRAKFNARRFCDTWRIFQTVFGSNARLVRVAATFTANTTYTDAFLQEMGSYGTDLTKGAATRPDVIAITTYFGNGIQDFVNQQGFATGKLFSDPYWSGPTFASDMTKAFDEWKRRILAGDEATGGGPDATGIGGGFDGASLRGMMESRLGYRLPIVAYEGGPSLFTDSIDSGGTTDDDGVTIFIEAMNRDTRIADVYRTHLELAKSKGLWTHTPYVDSSQWGRFGQWGHLETLDQVPANSPKYSLMLEHFTTHTALRHIDAASGAVPSFTTGTTLPPGIFGQSYTQDLVTTGGNGARTIVLISALLDPGLSVSAAPTTGNLRVSGTPTTSGKNFIFARVNDADGDPAWRIFTLETFGGPGTLVQSDFRGTNPAQNRPWTPTYVLDSRVTWSGWNIGSGIVPQNGNDAFFFNVSGPAADPGSTLPDAVTDQEFLTATVTPVSGPLDLRKAEFRFSFKRVGDHSPKTYAVFTSVGGFTAGNEIGSSVTVQSFDKDETETKITLPNTASYSSINSALTFRIYAYGAKFDGHLTSITAFKLTLDTSSTPPAAPMNLVATASGSTSVALSWTLSPLATSYEVFRRSGSGSEASIGTTAGLTFNDNAAASSTAHFYRVRAISAGGPSALSVGSLATTVPFTDEPIAAASTPIRKTHLTELRTAINAVRTLAGLGAFTFTDSTITQGVTTCRAVHVTELRTALTPALTALGLSSPSYAAGATAGSPVLQAHFQELRTLIK